VILGSILVDFLSGHREVIAAYLFGSQAKGTVCRRPVDVVILNRAPLVLRNQVLKYGRLIYERDHHQRVAFEVQSRFAYFDFKPVLDLLHSTLLRQIQEEGLADRYRGRRNALGDARRARDRFESLTTDQL
jgi:predicted nucleotidyltransferase